MKKIKLSLEGMHCASCAGNVQKCLMSIKGVKDAKVSLLFKKAEIETEDNVTNEEIKKTIAKIGYKAEVK